MHLLQRSFYTDSLHRLPLQRVLQLRDVHHTWQFSSPDDRKPAGQLRAEEHGEGARHAADRDSDVPRAADYFISVDLPILTVSYAPYQFSACPPSSPSRSFPS